MKRRLRMVNEKRYQLHRTISFSETEIGALRVFHGATLDGKISLNLFSLFYGSKAGLVGKGC